MPSSSSLTPLLCLLKSYPSFKVQRILFLYESLLCFRLQRIPPSPWTSSAFCIPNTEFTTLGLGLDAGWESGKITLILTITLITRVITSSHLPRVCYRPNLLPSILSTLEHPPPAAVLWGRYHFLHFRDEEVIGTEKLSNLPRVTQES